MAAKIHLCSKREKEKRRKAWSPKEENTKETKGGKKKKKKQSGAPIGWEAEEGERGSERKRTFLSFGEHNRNTSNTPCLLCDLAHRPRDELHPRLPAAPPHVRAKLLRGEVNIFENWCRNEKMH